MGPSAGTPPGRGPEGPAVHADGEQPPQQGRAALVDQAPGEPGLLVGGQRVVVVAQIPIAESRGACDERDAQGVDLGLLEIDAGLTVQHLERASADVITRW